MPPHSVHLSSSLEYDDRDDGVVTSTLAAPRLQRRLTLTRSSSFTALEMVAKNTPAVIAPSTHTIPAGSSASLIRSRLFNRLGISARESEQHVPRTLDTVNLLKRGQTLSFEEMLKADFGRPDRDLLKNNKQATVVTGGSKRSSVSFCAVVRVHTIPTRYEYSARIRGTLWTPPLEMQQNAARNSLEFAAEGWDWRNVANDEDMVICSGEKIHPIHFCDQSNCHLAVS